MIYFCYLFDKEFRILTFDIHFKTHFKVEKLLIVHSVSSEKISWKKKWDFALKYL